MGEPSGVDCVALAPPRGQHNQPVTGRTSTAPPDPVRQFSVFTENRVGLLYDLIGLLAHINVHVMAITVLDTTDSAIVRVIVDDPDRARELMVNNDIPFSETEVLAVEITDESQLKGVLAVLLEAEVNIHYTYCFLKRPEGLSALALSVEDADVAGQALSTRGFRILTQGDISR